MAKMRKFKKALKSGSRKRMSVSDWSEIRGLLGSDARRGVLRKAKSNPVSMASLARGIKAKWVKIRKVKNGIRVTIKK